MEVVKIKFHKLDKEYFFLPEFKEEDVSELAINDQVVVQTSLGKDIGIVTGWADWQASSKTDDNKNNNIIEQNKITDIKPMLRKVNQEDLDILKEQAQNYSEYLYSCRQFCKENNLKAMKLIDTSESFDGRRLTFYFVANSRVDFRELVKFLVQKFHKKIRLQQVGVRDATKISEDFGSCGLPLCCHAWLKAIGNVSPDYIKDQELSHRGADRLTGPCGRLKCCLRFEEETYKYNLEKLPKKGEIIKTRAGQAQVISVHPLKQTVDLSINGVRVEYPYLEGSLCEGEPKQ